jgi:hypothetical protein
MIQSVKKLFTARTDLFTLTSPLHFTLSSAITHNPTHSLWPPLLLTGGKHLLYSCPNLWDFYFTLLHVTFGASEFCSLCLPSLWLVFATSLHIVFCNDPHSHPPLLSPLQLTGGEHSVFSCQNFIHSTSRYVTF